MAKAKKDEIQKDTPKNDTKYTKEQLVTSRKYENRTDVIKVVVSEEEELTIDEVNEKIDEFMKGMVN